MPIDATKKIPPHFYRSSEADLCPGEQRRAECRSECRLVVGARFGFESGAGVSSCQTAYPLTEVDGLGVTGLSFTGRRAILNRSGQGHRTENAMN
jgi:hypothetical protein